MNNGARQSDVVSKLDSVRGAVETALKDESTGHDVHHAFRVARMSALLATSEGADLLVCELAALTHDLGRPDERETGAPHWGSDALDRIGTLLTRNGFEPDTVERVLTCVAEHEQYEFLGDDPPTSIESAVLQDADRLDAIGAMGIARVFMFAGAYGEPLWVPDVDWDDWTPAGTSVSAVHHIHAKCMKLYDGMHTTKGREMANQRMQFTRSFLAQFQSEWGER